MALVVALDLYRRPVALVGAGWGAWAAARVARGWPGVAGAVVAADLVRPAGVAGAWASGEALSRLAGSDADAGGVAGLLSSEALGGPGRPPEGVLRQAAWLAAWEGPRMGRVRVPRGLPVLRGGPDAVAAALADCPCPALVLLPGGAGVPRPDPVAPGAGPVRVSLLRGPGLFTQSDRAGDLAAHAEAFLGEHPLALAGGAPAARTPERLGLRSLPEFASLEAARRALGPR